MIQLSSIIQRFEANFLAQYQDRILPSHRHVGVNIGECIGVGLLKVRYKLMLELLYRFRQN